MQLHYPLYFPQKILHYTVALQPVPRRLVRELALVPSCASTVRVPGAEIVAGLFTLHLAFGVGGISGFLSGGLR